MDLKVLIQNCVLMKQGNYFMVVQIDELQFAGKDKRIQKFRSEVQFTTAHPSFKKNVYQFTNVSYGNRVTLKIGCFDTRLSSEPKEQKKLLEHSILHGSMQLVLTVKLLDVLRIEGQLQHESLLYDAEDQRVEKGRITILLRHQSHDLQAQVEDDVERIEQIYYDPFEKDPEIIRQKLQRVELKLVSLAQSIEPIMKKVHFLRTAHKQISYDLSTLRQQKEYLENENLQFSKMVEKKNDVKELHIQIDLLCNTDQGQDLLKKKLSLLLNKLEFERKIYHELSNHYYQIEHAHQDAKSKTQELQTLKDTIQEQEFLIKRLEDQKPLVNNLKETMENQEHIILSLQETIKDASRNFTRLDKQQLLYDLDKMRADQQLLKQKQIQLQHIAEMNKGDIPRSFFEQFKSDEFFKDNPIIVNKFSKRAEMLLKEVELLQEGLAEVKYTPTQRPKTSTASDTVLLQLEIQQAENKAEILEEQMLAVARNYAKQIADLKAQLNIIEAQL